MEITSVALAPDGARALTASRDYTFRLWDLAGRAPIQLVRGHGRPVYGVAFDKNSVVSAGGDGTLRVWDARTGAETQVMTIAKNAAAYAVATTPDGHQAVVGSDDGKLHGIWAAPRSSAPRRPAPAASSAWPCPPTARARSPAAATARSRCGMWASGASWAASSRDSQVNTVAFAPDGKHAVAGFDNTQLRLYDIARARERRSSWATRAWSSARWSPDGHSLLSASEDDTLRVWEVAGQTWSVLAGHTAAVTSVAYCPDGSCADPRGARTAPCWCGTSQPGGSSIASICRPPTTMPCRSRSAPTAGMSPLAQNVAWFWSSSFCRCPDKMRP